MNVPPERTTLTDAAHEMAPLKRPQVSSVAAREKREDVLGLEEKNVLCSADEGDIGGPGDGRAKVVHT